MEDTLADIGRVRVIIGMVLATLFMIGMIIGGIAMIRKETQEQTLAESNKRTGYIMIAVGVGIFLFALLIWWLTNRYKGFAAYEGVAGVADMARQTL